MSTVTKPMMLNSTASLINTSLEKASLQKISWADADDDMLYEIMRRNNNDEISITDDLGWTEGDVREVKLTNGETHKFILSDPGHFELVNALPNGKTTCNFVVIMEDCLGTTYRMNSSNTNTGSWKSSEMRANIVSRTLYYFPEGLRSILKPVKVKTATEYNSGGITTTEDTIALFAEKEVFGSKTYSTDAEAVALTQLNYFKTVSNRIKTVNGSASYWWLRSPYYNGATYFCAVTTDGAAGGDTASYARGVCAFCCI